MLERSIRCCAKSPDYLRGGFTTFDDDRGFVQAFSLLYVIIGCPITNPFIVQP